jgi:hypothetical protein
MNGRTFSVLAMKYSVMGRKWKNFDNWDALRNIYL